MNNRLSYAPDVACSEVTFAAVVASLSIGNGDFNTSQCSSNNLTQFNTPPPHLTYINISRKDVVWNHAGKIGVGVILLAGILQEFPTETVAVWNIFAAGIALAALFDFGFNPSFARN